MMRRLGAAGLILSLIAVLAAAVIPTCAGSLCCATHPGATLQPQMACCEPALTARNAELQPVTAAGPAFVPPVFVPVGTVVPHPEIARAAVSPPPEPHGEASPPLFLRNEQFLI